MPKTERFYIFSPDDDQTSLGEFSSLNEASDALGDHPKGSYVLSDKEWKREKQDSYGNGVSPDDVIWTSIGGHTL